MFARFFNTESPFWRAMGTIADIIWLNILFVVCCLPVVTVGASLTALYGTAMRVQDEEDNGVTRTFFRIFRSSFWPATGLWGIYGVIGAAIVAAWFYFPDSAFLPVKAALSAVYVVIFPFPWILQATFSNSFANTLKNSVLIPLGRLPWALGIGVISLLIIALIMATWHYLPAVLPPLLLGAFGLVSYAQVPLIKKTLLPWLPQERS